ncbi:uncharacterized protein LOC122791434 [Protopterus annectens]|uniref:uncharacterized protein LOC122791434 n=1 Tax=Protopterus annectens TaxID=7888 RepID=UPI001CFA9709|nr:uncharacterized protein LOC122791434 [Protopterus annectens]
MDSRDGDHDLLRLEDGTETTNGADGAVDTSAPAGADLEEKVLEASAPAEADEEDCDIAVSAPAGADSKQSKKSTVKGQLVRGSRMTSDDDEYLKEVHLQRNMFLERGYPIYMIDEVTQEVTLHRRNRFAPILGRDDINVRTEEMNRKDNDYENIFVLDYSGDTKVITEALKEEWDRFSKLSVLSPFLPVKAKVGDNVILKCKVQSTVSLDELEVEWKQEDTNAQVHLYKDGEDNNENQYLHYWGRTGLFYKELSKGNISLTIRNVYTHDQGQYQCKVKSKLQSGVAFVELRVTGSDGSVNSFPENETSLRWISLRQGTTSQTMVQDIFLVVVIWLFLKFLVKHLGYKGFSAAVFMGLILSKSSFTYLTLGLAEGDFTFQTKAAISIIIFIILWYVEQWRKGSGDKMCLIVTYCMVLSLSLCLRH